MRHNFRGSRLLRARPIHGVKLVRLSPLWHHRNEFLMRYARSIAALVILVIVGCALPAFAAASPLPSATATRMPTMPCCPSRHGAIDGRHGDRGRTNTSHAPVPDRNCCYASHSLPAALQAASTSVPSLVYVARAVTIDNRGRDSHTANIALDRPCVSSPPITVLRI
jgi:hypothetical protein